jgi:hypothetical protein
MSGIMILLTVDFFGLAVALHRSTGARLLTGALATSRRRDPGTGLGRAARLEEIDHSLAFDGATHRWERLE